MRRSFLLAIIPALAFAAASLVSTREAAAGPKLDFDLDLGTAFQRRAGVSTVDFSGGGGLRLGYRFNIRGSAVYLQPELGGHYMRLGFDSVTGGYNYAATVNGGLKLGLQGIVQPNIFAHVGLGILGYEVARDTISGYLGPAADIGAGIDFRVLPGFTIGAQIAYNTAAVPGEVVGTGPDVSAKWLNFGLTAGFHFMEAPPRRVYVRRGYY